MAVHEAVAYLQGRSIHNQCCWSVLADSPCQHACWVLEAGKLCTSHCYRIHTQPWPAPKALAQLLQNHLKGTKHTGSLQNKTCYCTKTCYPFKHCNITAKNWSEQKPLVPDLLDRIRAVESRHILRRAIDSRNSAGSFSLEGVCFRASRLRKFELSFRCLWPPFNPEQNRESCVNNKSAFRNKHADFK